MVESESRQQTAARPLLHSQVVAHGLPRQAYPDLAALLAILAAGLDGLGERVVQVVIPAGKRDRVRACDSSTSSMRKLHKAA